MAGGRNKSELQPLFKAAADNNLDTVRAFIDKKKVPIDVIDEDGLTVAHIAAKNGNLNIVRYIVEKRPTILKTHDAFGDSIFFHAIEKGAIDIVKYLVEKHKQDVCQRHPRSKKLTTLNIAIEFGHFEVLKYFITSKNADVDWPNNYNETPVFSAVEYERLEIFKYLVEEKNANLTALDENNDNILFMMVRKNNLSLMKYVLDEKKVQFDIDWRNDFGYTLVHRTAVLNRLSILDYLVTEKRANVNIPDKENVTALHYAAFTNRNEICKYLIEHGADPRVEDNFGKKVWERATDERLVEYLKNVSNKSSVRRRRRARWTPSSVFSPIAVFKTSHLLSQRPAELHFNKAVLPGFEMDFRENISPMSTQFWSFLMLTISMVTGTVRHIQSKMFLSPTEILHNQMNSLAAESVNNLSYQRSESLNKDFPGE